MGGGEVKRPLWAPLLALLGVGRKPCCTCAHYRSGGILHGPVCRSQEVYERGLRWSWVRGCIQRYVIDPNRWGGCRFWMLEEDEPTKWEVGK